MSRLVLFGAAERASAALREPDAARYLLRVARIPSPDAPPAVVREAGLVRPGPAGWQVTDLVRVAEPRDLSTAAHAVARLVRARLPRLASLRGALPWPDVAFTVVAGLLLDLAVGERLRATGLVPPAPAGFSIWVLPAEPVSVGVHCVYDPQLRAGAGEVRVAGMPDPAGVTPDTPGLLAAAAQGGPGAALPRLTLTYQGWLGGGQPRYVDWARGDGDPLASTAAELVYAVYRPTLARCADPHLSARLLLDAAVRALIEAGTISVRAGDIRRFRWLGSNFRRVEEAAG